MHDAKFGSLMERIPFLDTEDQTDSNYFEV